MESKLYKMNFKKLPYCDRHFDSRRNYTKGTRYYQIFQKVANYYLINNILIIKNKNQNNPNVKNFD